MLDAHYVFKTASFRDGDEDRSQSVNDIAGAELARWLAQRLQDGGYRADEPWPEDHGWDFGVVAGDAKYLLSCSIDESDESPYEAHIGLIKARSLWDKVRWRNAYQQGDGVATAVQGALAACVDVQDLVVEA